MPDVEAMVSPIIFTPGSVPISDCPLRPDLMYEDHARYHSSCSSSCYIHRLVAVAANGWRLTFRRDRPVNIMSRSFNHKPFVQFGALSEAALEKQFLNSGACAPLPIPHPVNSRTRPIFSPLLSVIRNSDLWRASVLGISVTDSESLAAANNQLIPPIKLRICLDVSSSGLNDAMPDFPFGYASLEDGLAMITPQSWTAKIDLTAMFNSIGLAYHSRRYFTFRDSKGVAYGYTRDFFGCKLFPAVASGFMAEIQYILSSEGVPCISYMDDFLVAGCTYAECLNRRNNITARLERYGWSVNYEKVTEPSQVTEFLGVVIDTNRMLLSIEASKASSALFKLERAIEAIYQQNYPLASKIWHSLLGILSWFSSVLSVGRLWNISLFQLLKALLAPRPEQNPLAILTSTRCTSSLNFWRATLGSLSVNQLSPANIKILPPRSVEDALFYQGDAGDEGLGYWIASPSDGFHSIKWFASTLPFDSTTTSSTFKELATLRWAIQSHPEWAGQLIICVFDSAAAAYNLNSSTCSPGCFVVLHDIMSACDTRMISIVALWVSRDDNTFADYLTHHCLAVHRKVDRGVVNI